MPSHVSESDWSQFKRVRSVMLERYCSRVLSELRATIDEAGGTSHERYVKAYRLLQSRDEDLSRAFDDYRRSAMVMQLAAMRAMALLTDEELSGFSEETQARVRGCVSILGGEPEGGANRK